MRTSKGAIRRYIRIEIQKAIQEATDPKVKSAKIKAAQAKLDSLKADTEATKKELVAAQAMEGFIKLSGLLEADEEKSEEEGGEEENPFAASEDGDAKEGDAEEDGGDEKEDGGDEKAAEKQPAQPAGIPVKFNTSQVKKYNQAQFTTDTGVVKSVSKDGLVVTTQPDGVDVLVNFNDITESVKRFFKTAQ